MPLVISGASSGQTTLAATDAVTATITLPSAAGTLATLTTPAFATTIGVGGATPSASGAGITFPATQSASTNANTLDDYEEGTWTPAVSGGGLTVNSATYTKIGEVVTLRMDVSITSVSAGNITITGIPFSASSNSVSAVGGDQFDFSTALIGLHAWVNTSPEMFFFYFTNGSNGIRLTNSNIRVGTTIRTTHTYRST